MYAYFLRRMSVLGILVIVGFSAVPADANEDHFTVFEIRKKLQMANDEPIVKDYYISAGAKAGLKTEMIIDVRRRIPIHDGFKNQSRGDLAVTIGKVQIIHVEEDLAVARLFSETSPVQRPITGFETVMIGDFLDISSAAMLVPKSKSKAAATAAEEAKPKEANEAAEENKTSTPALAPSSVAPPPTHALAPIPAEAPQLPVPIGVN